MAIIALHTDGVGILPANRTREGIASGELYFDGLLVTNEHLNLADAGKTGIKQLGCHMGCFDFGALQYCKGLLSPTGCPKRRAENRAKPSKGQIEKEYAATEKQRDTMLRASFETPTELPHLP